MYAQQDLLAVVQLRSKEQLMTGHWTCQAAAKANKVSLLCRHCLNSTHFAAFVLQLRHRALVLLKLCQDVCECNGTGVLDWELSAV
jgi:hypothetical protein